MIGNSLYPLSNRPRRSSRASTLKSFRSNPRLIATSHKLAALKRSSLSGLPIKVRARFESRWGPPQPTGEDVYPEEVSSTSAEASLDLLLAHSVKVVRHRDRPRHEPEPPY